MRPISSKQSTETLQELQLTNKEMLLLSHADNQIKAIHEIQQASSKILPNINDN